MFSNPYSISSQKLSIIIIFILVLYINYLFETINNQSMNKAIYNRINYKNIIHITMSFEVFYLSPTLVSITSVLINAKNDTFINYHLLIDNTIKREHKLMIKSLAKLHRLTHFSFYYVGNIFKDFLIRRGHLKLPVFFYLAADLFLVNIDKTIYLDSDTLIYSDLSDMYNLDMTGLYFRGILDQSKFFNIVNSIKTDHFINSGVLLMNVKKYRDDKIFRKMIEYSQSHILVQEDQELINNNKILVVLIMFLLLKELYIVINVENLVNYFDKLDKFNVEKILNKELDTMFNETNEEILTQFVFLE